ncbi:NAD(P)H-dependent oxidoreductase [Aureimonas pseudogalii]|uniref:Putative homoserine dehydrogenase-like protein n=1 Tax=Aureimonas pseudogalii TaxID=1744844 RepID=A0A7W6H341_9HYPH|nr:homoserine dehydrogenase [Aureimonas pseudogalii]MBB3996767.1 putative homoserine dehydrogenase-like protein [Aureimonas pseudogalii]
MDGIAKVGLAAELLAHAERHGPVTVGLAGAGQMGTDLMVQLRLMPGVRLGAVSTSRPGAARETLRFAGYEAGDVVEAGSPAAVDAAIEAGRVALVADFRTFCAAGRIDVVIDATGSPSAGTRIALDAFRNGKHVVMLNVEADITIGRALAAEARSAGVVYTGAAGDEPHATLELIGLAQALGLDIVAAGKGKNNPLDFAAVPADYEEEAARRNMNARMLVEFVDGSKTMVEMTAIANATGLVPDVPGMHGPNATAEDLAQVLCTREDGGILTKPGCVDYSIGRGVAPGVFCIVKPRHPRVLERIADLKVGPGPCFALYRPFHLTSIEVPLSAIHAVMRGVPHMEPLERPVAECIAVAKRDLAVGETLGRIGETQYRGFAMVWAEARAAGGLPLGLAEGGRVTQAVKAGDKLTYANCAPDETQEVTQIRRRLDAADARFA